MNRLTSLRSFVLFGFMLTLSMASANASIAYGSVNNFDTVNDTGVPCHGFEIELDDIHSANITYTFDYNHYGVPKITEDNSNPAHPKVFVRYQGIYKSGTWSAFTAVPSAPIAPTQGHQFTNPSVNFGGEHFGVGYSAPPSAVKYNWLKDNGGGALIYAGSVNVATPVFNYAPAVPAAPGVPAVPAQVQAAIVPPPPPLPPPLEFGKAMWVKEIRTTTHNSNPVKIEELVSADADYPNAKNWAHGEPSQVEVEWQILQTDTGAANGGANGQLVAVAEPLPNGDEVVTRRYEFYEYGGPLDSETGEAGAQRVAADGVHGVGSYTDPLTSKYYDLTQIAVVGKFLGAQMSGFGAAAKLGLIDHLQDGEVGQPYVNRTVVVAGSVAFSATTSGVLPDGLSLDPVSGVFSGMPTSSGLFTFTVAANDLNSGTASKTYTVGIAAAGGALPPQSTISASALPDTEGSATGSGVYYNGTDVSLIATAALGYAFVNWTESGAVVSTSSSYTFAAASGRTLVANFAPALPVVTLAPATGVLNSSATLQDSVNPNSLATSAYYEYGLTPAYGSATPSQNIGNGSGVVLVSASLSGLLSGTTYHYRILATNSSGTSTGADQTILLPGLLEYALGVSPGNARSHGLQVAAKTTVNGIDYPVVSFNRRRGAALNYIVEESTDLISWQIVDQTTNALNAPIDLGNGFDQVEVRSNNAINGSGAPQKGFLRLKVTSP